MSLANFIAVDRARRAVLYGCEMPEEVETNDCNIEWLASEVITRENWVVTRVIEGVLSAVDVKTDERVPIKEHGVDGETVNCILMTTFVDGIQVQRRLWEIVTDINKFSTTVSSTTQLNLTDDVII